MCGIAGIVQRDGAPVDAARLGAMTDALSHRGPDDEGHWLRPEGDVGLGARRLAIVDLSPAGHQPMSNEDGSVVVAYNGEIYNHAELRAQLERRGHRFRSRCDTEVLVHLYEEHGAALVEHLVGMFAFAIWDESARRLLLGRDRLGIKPLYWIDDGRRFAFASEIKALLPLLERRAIDATALRHYLTFVTVPPPRTLFAGVSKLRAACTMTVEADRVGEPSVYWDPLTAAHASSPPTRDEWEYEVRNRLTRSVERRLMSDVPLGVFLSGGVDSSTNVALLRELGADPVRTFSIGFGDERVDELPAARRVAQRFATEHHEVVIGPDDLWEFLPRLVYHQDEPIADPICVPLHFLSELARRRGVVVVHVGEGSDEIFAGYPTYVTALRMATGPWRWLRGAPAPLRSALAHAGAGALRAAPRLEIHREALLRAADPGGRLWWGGAVAFYERGLARVTSPQLARDAGHPGPRDVVEEIARDADAAGARGELDRIVYQDLRLRLPELLLMRVDKLTMANSVEARVPFLDHELVELAMAMPAAEKVDGGVGKAVLKRAVAPLVGPEIAWAPKRGFAAPMAEWLRGTLAERLEVRLATSALNELGYLDRTAVSSLVQAHRAGRGDRSFQLWTLLNLAAWFDFWIAGIPDSQV